MVPVKRTKLEEQALARKRRRVAMIVGVVLALICKSLPPEYQEACSMVMSACQGGL